MVPALFLVKGDGEKEAKKNCQQSEKLSNFFMRNTARLGTIFFLKLEMELVPNADWHQKGARRMTRDKAENSIQEIGRL